jgi:hypothetical protein
MLVVACRLGPCYGSSIVPTAVGPTAIGPTAIGPTADGPAADGPAADGPAADGPAADGSAADSPAAGVPTADGPAADGPATDGPAARMIYMVILVKGVAMDLMVNLGVGMDMGMLDMGVNPHDLSGRREAAGARGDPRFQTLQSVE